MSSISINNFARAIDVSSVISVDSIQAANEIKPPLKRAGKETFAGFSAPSIGVSKNRLADADNTESVESLVLMFTSMFNQLLRLVSNKEDKPAPVIPPPAPKVTPRVVPEPVVPNAHPATDIPGLSGKRGGVKPENIWSGFRQGPDGNCVTVSAIKAAMHRFGQSPTDIYKQVTKVGDGYRVVMRDNFELTLTDRELAEGARGAQFKGRDNGMLKDAQFLFAVSAKRAQMENNDRTAGRGYQAAIRSLNDGEDEGGPGEGFLRLGLRQYMKTVPVQELARGQLGMCNRTGHSVAVINGCEELWGRAGSAPTQGDAIALI